MPQKNVSAVPVAPAAPPIAESKAAPVAAPKPDLAPRISRLLDTLSADDATARREAEDDLVLIGPSAVPAIKAALTSAAPERQRVLAHILRKIDADQELATMVQNRSRRHELALANGGSAETEAAVDNALAWLAKHQEEDGHWTGQDGDSDANKTATTGLALMAFLAAGNSEDTGPYHSNVERAERWLIDQQTPSGDFCSNTEGRYGYQQAMAAQAMAEAAVTGHRPETLAAAKLALRAAAANQSREGSWSYRPPSGSDRPIRGDLSITAWYSQFLHIARGHDLDANEDMLERVQNSLYSCFATEKGFGYADRANPSNSCTAMGCISIQMLRGPRDVARQSIAALSQNHPFPQLEKKDENWRFYTAYFQTMCLFQDGGEAWKNWNEAMKTELLKLQVHEGKDAGCWNGGELLGYMGRAGMTAVSALCLEVYYRYPRLDSK
jgi:hypothetical protein